MTAYGMTTGYYYLEPHSEFGIYRLDIERVTPKSFDCFIEKYLPNDTWRPLPIAEQKFYFSKGLNGISYPNLKIPLLEGEYLQISNDKNWYYNEMVYDESDFMEIAQEHEILI